MRWGWLAVLIAVATSTVGSARADAAPKPVTIFLDRGGRLVSKTVRIPRFGGGDRAWSGIVACVKEHYAPFQVDIVDEKPARGQFITAVIGGKASQLGLDDRWTNGVGPHSGRVIANAIVFIFSKVGTGERDVENLCAVTAHEVAHALGLDHSFKCGDIMSYWLDRCGTRQFMDADAPCGEDEARECAGGHASQNSYRRLGELVGFRDEQEVEDDDSWDAQPADPYEDDEAYEYEDDEAYEPPPPRYRERGNRYR